MEPGRVVYASELTQAWSKKRIVALLGLFVLPMILVQTGFNARAVAGFATTSDGNNTPATRATGEKVSSRKLIATIPVDAGDPRRACKRGGSDLPRLVLVQEWKTKKQRPRESITLMTQLSADRLTMLENQCRTWTDPLAAVVYVPLFRNTSGGMPIIPTYINTTLEDVIRGMDSFFHFMDATAQCALHVELVGQFLDPLAPEEYPINSLRNRALRMSKTELTFMLDVDFVASPNLGLPEPGYRDPAVYNQMAELTAMKKALVLPAFEITNRKQDLIMAQNFARNCVILGKEGMREQYLAGKVDAFNGQDAPWGHGPTNTSKWVRLSRPVTYRARYEPRYEPFLVMHRNVAPWADERFVGYGGNKIAYINQLNGLGVSFHVHPYGFVIHVPHVRTKAANTFVMQKRRGESQMDDLRALVESEVEKGIYAPHTVFCPEEEVTDAMVEEAAATLTAEFSNRNGGSGGSSGDNGGDADVQEKKKNALLLRR